MRTSKKENILLGGVIFLITILAWLAGIASLLQHRSVHVNLDLAEQTAVQENNWTATTDAHRHVTETYFRLFVMQPEVLALLAESLTADPQNLERIRSQLYQQLYPTYAQLRQKNIFQLHFHTPDSRSLLRFHDPNHYGDSLVSSRPAVDAANTKLKPIFTFETGRSMSAFRHIFPIVWDNRHLGSVEFSLPIDHLCRELTDLDPNYEYLLAVHEQTLRPKLFDAYKNRFAPSRFSPEWLLEDPVRKHPGEDIPLLSRQGQAIYEQLAHSQAFLAQLPSGHSNTLVVWVDKVPMRVTSLHLDDPWGTSKAVLLSFSPSEELSELFASYRLYLTLYSLLILVGGLFSYLFLRNVQTVRNQKEYLRLIADTMADSLYVLDQDGKITFVNRAATKDLGLAADELMGRVAHDLFHHHGSSTPTPLQNCPIYQVIHAGKRYQGEEWFCRADGTPFQVEVASQSMPKGNKDIGSVTVFRDITERKLLEEQLTLLSLTDPLTGAYNRRHFLQEMEIQHHRAVRHNTPFSLIMLDADHFKRINDSFGHETGDRVLQEIVARIRQRIRRTDLLARWGGEEFMLLLPDSHMEAARRLAQDLLETLQKKEIAGVGIVTASLGVVCYQPGETEDQLLARVDNLLYQAKVAGRNRVCATAETAGNGPTG